MINNKINTDFGQMVKQLREGLGYTQASLAEQTNLSVRTIQRVESGQSVPKGHTLTVLATALGVDKSELRQPANNATPVVDENLKLKLLNLSTLCFMGIPFGNIFIPLWIWLKNKEHQQVNEVGIKIVNFQISWSLTTAILLIISPFLQIGIFTDFPLVLVVGLLAICVNLFFIIKTAISLSRHDYDILPLKFQFL